MTWSDNISRPIIFTITLLVILLIVTYDYRNSTIVTAIIKAVIFAPSYYFAAAAFVLVAGKWWAERRRRHLSRPLRTEVSVNTQPVRAEDLPTPIDETSNAFTIYNTPPTRHPHRFVTLADLELGHTRS